MLATAAALLAKTSKPLCNQQPAGVARAAAAKSYSGFAETGKERHVGTGSYPKVKLQNPPDRRSSKADR